MFKTEVIKFPSPWKSVGEVDWGTPKRVDWYNNEHLHSAIGYITPQKAEEAFYASLNADEKGAQLLNQILSGKPGTVQTS